MFKNRCHWLASALSDRNLQGEVVKFRQSRQPVDTKLRTAIHNIPVGTFDKDNL